MYRNRFGGLAGLFFLLALLASLTFAPVVQAQTLEETATPWQRLSAFGQDLWQGALGVLGWAQEPAPEPGEMVTVTGAAGARISPAGFTGDDVETLDTQSNELIDPEELPTEEGPGISPAG